VQVGENTRLDPESFGVTVDLVQAYVRGEPGAWSAFVVQSRADPEGTARSLLTLGAVLLDIAAGAFRLSPDEMLDKVTRTVDLHRLEQSRRADSR
jgi:hypothetical protein